MGNNVDPSIIHLEPIRDCNRCGKCCQVIPLPCSPRELQRLSTERPDSEFAQIYHMLQGTCQGAFDFRRDDGSVGVIYVYGPCKNLQLQADGTGICGIYADRPPMCAHFPYYRHLKTTRGQVIALSGIDPNPSYMKGCAYNRDQESDALRPYMPLRPLTPEELDV